MGGVTAVAKEVQPHLSVMKGHSPTPPCQSSGHLKNITKINTRKMNLRRHQNKTLSLLDCTDIKSCCQIALKVLEQPSNSCAPLVMDLALIFGTHFK